MGGRILVQRPDLHCEHNQWQEFKESETLLSLFFLV